MKIKTMKIINFKHIVNDVVDFADNKIAVLTGPNGIGKTSFIEALQYGLTGVAPTNPIRDGAEYATVVITVEDGTQFSRTIFRDGRPSKVTVNGRVTPAKNLNIWIQECFGFSTDILKIATSAKMLTSLKSSDLGDFLLQYIPEKLNIAKVLGCLSSPTEKMQEAIIMALPEDDFEIGAITNAYEFFSDVRKSTKKDLEFIKGKLGRMPVDKPARSAAELQEALEMMLKKEGEAKASLEAIKLYKATLERRKSALKNIADLQAKLDRISATRPNPILREDACRKLEEQQNVINEAVKLSNIMTTTIGTLRITLDRLSTNHCPLSDSLVCTTDKTKVKGEILDVIKSNEEGLAIQQDKLEAAQKESAVLRAQIAAFDENAALYKEKIIIGEQLEKAKKIVPDIPVAPVDIEVTDFEREKAILKAELEYAKKWEEREALLQKQAEEEENVKLYDTLCKAFAPKGEVMTKIIASYLSIFEEEVNTRAALLRAGMSVKFIPENGVKFCVKVREDREFHVYDELSEGEKTLAAFLLLDLISLLCGTKIMVVDDLNNVDKNALHELFNFMSSPEFLRQYDNIILSSVNYGDFLDIIDKHASVIQTV